MREQAQRRRPVGGHHADRFAGARGASDAEILAQLERISPYQLHYMRPLGELLLSLPVDVRRYEIGAGITARRELIFTPLLHQTRAQQQLLAKLEPVAIAIAAERAAT